MHGCSDPLEVIISLKWIGLKLFSICLVKLKNLWIDLSTYRMTSYEIMHWPSCRIDRSNVFAVWTRYTTNTIFFNKNASGRISTNEWEQWLKTSRSGITKRVRLNKFLPFFIVKRWKDFVNESFKDFNVSSFCVDNSK